MAQSFLPLVATPGRVAGGGEFRAAGSGWPIGITVSFRLIQGDVTIPLGTADTGRIGAVNTLLKVPGNVAAGNYLLRAFNGTGTPLSAPIPIVVMPPPQITLTPSSAPPGSVIAVTVNNVQPGSLTLSYAGAAVIGPVTVTGSTYNSMFVVPGDRPTPLGTITTVSAVNRIGHLTVGIGTATFTSQPGNPNQVYHVAGLSAPLTAIQPGTSFQIQGMLNPAPVGPTSRIAIVPFWNDSTGRRIPIGSGPAQINPDGSFQVSAHVPSRLNGDPISSIPGETVGVRVQAPGGTTVQTTTVALALPDIFFRVQPVKDKPGAADNGQPIPNKPTATGTNSPPLRVLIEPLDSFNITQDQLNTAIDPGDGTPILDSSRLGLSQTDREAMKDTAVKIANCYREVSSIPQWEWRMGVDQTVYTSLGVTPGLSPVVRNQAVIKPAGLTAAAATENTILVQSFRVTVDASRVVDGTQKGYGEVTAQNVFVPSERYFLYIPSLDRAFLLNQGSGIANEVTLPAKIALKPLPSGWKSILGIRFIDVVNDTEPPIVKSGTVGPFYTFAGDDGISFEEVNPIQLRISLDQVPTGAPVVSMKFDSTALTVTRVVDTPPPASYNPCSGSEPVVFPESDYAFYEATIPNSHLVQPGPHLLTVIASDGANTQVTSQVPLTFVSYKPYSAWFDGPQTITNRRVIAWPTSAVLKGIPFNKNTSRLTIGEDVDDIPGPQQSKASLGGEVITQLYPPRLNPQPSESFESTIGQNGSMDGESMDNATKPQNFGQSSTTAAAKPAHAHDLASQLSLGLQSNYDNTETFTILDTGRVTIFKAGYGIPEIAFIGIAVDFRIKATLTLQYTLALNDIGFKATLDTTVDVKVKVDVDVLLGLADAEVGVNPLIAVQIPLELSATKGTADIGACFHYAMDLYYQISILWGIGSWDGTVNVFKGDEPNSCYQKVKALLNQSDAVPNTSPAVATDGLGTTMAIWRNSSGDIVASLLQGGSWGPELNVTNNGKSGNPTLAFFAPGKAVAVWSQSGLSSAPTRDTPLEEILSQQHLAYAVWDGSVWSSPQNLTNPGGGDGKAHLAGCVAGLPTCPSSGAATVVWVHDTAGDYTQHKFNVYSATYQNGTWSVSQAVDGATGASETEPQVMYKGPQPLAFWVRDSDRDPATPQDRRMVLRALGSGPVVEPGNLPNGILRPRVDLDSNGHLQFAYTTVTGNDGIVGNRHVLQRAVATGCNTLAANCIWASEEIKDSLGRTIFAESPVVTVDNANRVILTYRAMGLSPFNAGAGIGADIPDPIGMQALTGELAQLELTPNVGGTIGLPTYLSNDGAVNLRPTAVYDPQLDSVIALVVKGTSPLGNRQVNTPATAVSSSDGPAFVATPRLPNLRVALLTPSESLPTGTIPVSLTASIQNIGAGWQQGAGPALTITATWDGPPGIGAPAAQTTLSMLTAGEAADVVLNLQAPANPLAPHTLVVTANNGQVIEESSADDNSLSLDLGQITPPSQLYAEVAIGSPSIRLTWAAPTDPRVIGYRIYRVGADGERSAVGSAFESTWIDPQGVFGQEHTYVVTSFDADLVESLPTAPASATPNFAPFYRLNLPLLVR